MAEYNGENIDDLLSRILGDESNNDMLSSKQLREKSKNALDEILDKYSAGNVNEILSNLESIKDEITEIEKKRNSVGKLNKDDEKRLKALREQYSDIKNDTQDISKHLKSINETTGAKGVGRNASILKGLVNDIFNNIRGMYNAFKDFNEPWARADNAASKYAKTIGLAKQGMDALRTSTINTMYDRRIGIHYNVSTDELLQMQNDFAKGVGRNILIDANSQETLAAMHAVMNGSENQLATSLENFGINLEDTGKHVGKMFSSASKSGISFEKYTKNVVDNIKIAQNYTFRNGIAGLESMAKKASAIRMDMASVASLAERVNTVEGSIDVASKLQVLGGTFASFADPMGMLNESLNDMEAFGDRMNKMYSTLGTFNKTTGEVEISAFNKQRIRAYANATGQDVSSVMESVNTQTKLNEVNAQIGASYTASQFSDDFKELIRNSATFKNGKAGVSINGEWKSIDELNEGKDMDALISATQSESEDIKQIARDLRSLVDLRSGLGKQYDVVKSNIVDNTGLGTLAKNLNNVIGHASWLLGGAAIGKLVGTLGLNIFSLFNPFGKMGSVGKLGKYIKGLFSKRGAGSYSATGSRVFSSVGEGAKNLFSKIKKPFSADRFQNLWRTSKEGVSSTKSTNAFSSIKNAVSGTKGILKYKNGPERIKALRDIAKFKSAVPKLARGGGAFAAITAGLETGIEEFGGKNNHSTKRKVGSTVGSAAGGGLGAWGGASLGAAIGTAILPGIGTAIGGALGAAVGGFSGSKLGKWIGSGFADDKGREALKKKYNLDLKGDYTKSHIKEINQARSTGKISEDLLEQLRKNGDTAIYNEIKKAQSNKNDEISKKIEKANFVINSASFNGEDIDEITKIGANPLGNTINISPIRETGYSNNGVVREKRNEYADAKARKQYYENSNKPIDINFNGTIKLEGANGHKVDITSELLGNKIFLSKITELITQEVNKKQYGVWRPDQ